MELTFTPTGDKNFDMNHRVNHLSETYLFIRADKEVAKMVTSFKNGKFYTVFEVNATDATPFCIASSKHDYQEYSEREAIRGVGLAFEKGSTMSIWEMLQKIEAHLGAKMFHITC